MRESIASNQMRGLARIDLIIARIFGRKPERNEDILRELNCYAAIAEVLVVYGASRPMYIIARVNFSVRGVLR